ncbi:hypothetical protein D3C77_453900 [compost metagenome]
MGHASVCQGTHCGYAFAAQGIFQFRQQHRIDDVGTLAFNRVAAELIESFMDYLGHAPGGRSSRRQPRSSNPFTGVNRVSIFLLTTLVVIWKTVITDKLLTSEQLRSFFHLCDDVPDRIRSRVLVD